MCLEVAGASSCPTRQRPGGHRCARPTAAADLWQQRPARIGMRALQIRKRPAGIPALQMRKDDAGAKGARVWFDPLRAGRPVRIEE